MKKQLSMQIMFRRTLAVTAVMGVFSVSGFAQALQGYAFFAPGQMRTPGESPFAMHFGGGTKYASYFRVR